VMIGRGAAMRELTGGNFDFILLGPGRKDEIGEMAYTAEELKMQAETEATQKAL